MFILNWRGIEIKLDITDDGFILPASRYQRCYCESVGKKGDLFKFSAGELLSFTKWLKQTYPP